MKKIAIITTVDVTIKAFMINHLKKLSEKYDVTVITNTSNTDFLLEFGLKNIKVIKLDIKRNINIIKDIKSLIQLINLLKKERFETIHSITPKAGLLTALSGKILGVKTRIHTFTGQVWVTEKGPKKILLKTLDKVIAFCNNKILADSPSQLEFLRKEKILKKNMGEVLGKGSISGVDLEKFKFDKEIRNKLRKKHNILGDDIVYGFIGRLKKDKGIYELLEAFKKVNLKNKKLLIIGPDEEGISKALKYENVIYLGFQSNPNFYLNMFDIFCLPSYREGFGSVIIEAAAMGIPAIVSNIYGLSDAVEKNETGLLHEMKNVQEIKEKMEFLAKNTNLRNEMGIKARERVEKSFSSEYSSQCLIDFYNKILGEKNV